MVLPKFSTVLNLLLAYPEKYHNEYEKLTFFYDSLIDLIPPEITIWLVTNNSSTKKRLNSKLKHKNANVIQISGWDEIWLRDCLGIHTVDFIAKPTYHPIYCNFHLHGKYFHSVCELSKTIVKECINKPVISLPLKLDGGNFVSNSKLAFITNKVVEDNPKYSASEIIKILSDYLSVRPLIIERSISDNIGHVDGFMNFISNNKVVVSNYPSFTFLKDDIKFVLTLKNNIKKEKLDVIEILDRPVDEPAKCGCFRKTKKSCYYTARGNYINFIMINKTIILPEYTLPTKKESKYYNSINKITLQKLGYNIISINCDAPATFGGSLHCLSYTF